MATRKRKVAWDGIVLEYSRFDCSAGLFVSLAIAETKQSPIIPSHLHLLLKPTLLDPNLAQQIQSIPVPLNYYCEVKDASILHLVELLQIEMQAPKPMSQMFVSSIVLVLVTHLLQQWQLEDV
ncbi:hypothetical protein ACQ4M3_18490 [Leptolyngbya sp. AN03gr2]|uniref:hypothetical protein n=1 Tax=unclassified Leptolyngbya TaxID=2650499 RepID=UPI003D31ACA6